MMCFACTRISLRAACKHAMMTAAALNAAHANNARVRMINQAINFSNKVCGMKSASKCRRAASTIATLGIVANIYIIHTIYIRLALSRTILCL